MPSSRRARAPGAAGLSAGMVELRRGAERGSGTVLALALVAVIIVLAVALGALGSAQAARGSAQTAADLAALAAASALRDGYDPCAVAERTAARNRSRIEVCVREGGGVVRVEVSGPTSSTLLGALVGEARAAARAGPASAR